MEREKDFASVHAERTLLNGLRLGHLASGSRPGALLVDYPGNVHGPLPAQAVSVFDERAIEDAVLRRQPVVLLFENGASDRPIVMGLIQPSPEEAEFRELLRKRAPEPGAPPKLQAEARVDGNRLVLEGYEQVTLKCGEASVTLTKNGKLILKGAYVETRASGVNRIKGGSVKIN